MVAGGELYSQTPLPFWWAMAASIAIGSLVTAVDWFISFTLHEPITCSHDCVIEKGFSEGEKRDFPIHTVLVPISQGTKVMKVTDYVFFPCHFLMHINLWIFLGHVNKFLQVRLNTFWYQTMSNNTLLVFI